MGRLKTLEERQRKIMARKEEKKKLHKLAIAARLAQTRAMLAKAVEGIGVKDEKPI